LLLYQADRFIGMEELCANSAENDAALQDKLSRFLEDKSIDAVTGIRRMGRENLVDFTYRMCVDRGFRASLFPEIPPEGILLFHHWVEMDENLDKLSDDGSRLDIIYGQDLCHQVPAIVRLRR